MAYKNEFQEQKESDYEYFKTVVEFIEDSFKDDVSKYINGKYIFVLLGGIYECSRFVNTTVSDLREICGNIDIDCILHGTDNIKNIFMYSLKEPNKKSFRGKIKFTPKGTISMSCFGLSKDKKGRCVSVGQRNIPILQDEDFLVSRCKEAFENNEADVDYDYIEQHAFKFLHADKRLSCCGAKDVGVKQQKAMKNHSKNIQKIISLYFDMENSWGVCLYHENNCFIFPMKREYIQKVFKNRDKEDGRRRVIASVVNDYTRKNGTEVDGHLRTKGTFTMEGRKYAILVGGEDWDRIFKNTDKSRARLKKVIENSDFDGKFMIKH